MDSLRQVAERLLFGKDLEDKFVSPLGTQDLDLRSFQPRVITPGRPPELAFSKSKDSHFLRKVKGIQSDLERGQLLHFFANHEILAIELMALALLKFPDAPSEFRQTLCRTIVDEQKHAKMYFHRMKECGVSMGDVPLSSAFWDQLHGMKSVQEYICGLSLTLEQANLDFAHDFAQKFERAGDERTAKVLWTVYQDELFHVEVGVKEMNRLRGEQSQWDFYCEHLLEPLSPVKAKAAPFLEKPRQDLGLDDDYIEQLKQYQRSKGRPPDVWSYNGLAECEMAGGGAVSQRLQQGAVDLESVMHLFGVRDDVLRLNRELHPSFLEHCEQSQRSLPEIHLGLGDIRHRRLGEFKPWAWSPSVLKSVAPQLSQQTRTFRTKSSMVWNEGLKELSSKVFQRSLEQKLLLRLQQHDSFKGNGAGVSLAVGAPKYEVFEALEPCLNFLEASSESWLLKAPFGASAQGIRFFHGAGGETLGAAVSHAADLSATKSHAAELNVTKRSAAKSSTAKPSAAIPHKWIKRVLREQGSILLEQRWERRADFSIQGHFDGERIRWQGVSRMLIDAKGCYRGAYLQTLYHDLSEDERRLLHPCGQTIFRVLQDELKVDLLPLFQSRGFVGSFGIDTFLGRVDEGWFFRPFCELNPRMTFGSVALSVEKRMAKGSCGLMSLESAAEVPPSLEFELNDKGQWLKGRFALNDVWSSELRQVWARVEQDPQKLNEHLEALGVS